VCRWRAAQVTVINTALGCLIHNATPACDTIQAVALEVYDKEQRND